MQPLEQVVRQESVLGYLVAERGIERVDVVKSFAGEDTLAEQVLVRIRYGGRIRVDPRVSGVQPREQRPGGAAERDADARLQDAVAGSHPSALGVELRAVERMRDDTDQIPGRVARQPRVAVERDAVADLRQDAQLAHGDDEAGVGCAAQQAVELLDLPALAFPSHPQLFARVPLTL